MAISGLKLLQELRNAVARAVEASTWAFKFINYEHSEVHKGNFFNVSYDAELGNGETMEILIVTPDTTKWPHITIAASTALKGRVDLYEDAVQGYVAANALTPQNRQRNYETSKLSGLLICHTPGWNSSSSSSGVEIEERIARRAWGATGIGNNPGFGGEGRAAQEWVLKQNTTYLLRITSEVETNVAWMEIDWYEHANKA